MRTISPNLAFDGLPNSAPTQSRLPLRAPIIGRLSPCLQRRVSLSCLYSVRSLDYVTYHVQMVKKAFFRAKNEGVQKRRFSEKKIAIGLDLLLANLNLVINEDKQLIVPVKVNGLLVSYKVINQLIEYLERNEYIFVTDGKQNQFDGLARTIKPTDKLIAELEYYKIELMLNENAPFVELRNLEKQAAPRLRKDDKHRARADMVVSEYNHYWLNNHVTLNDKPVMPFCRRIYSNSSFQLGGRYYGRYQQLSKLDRQELLIDGLPVAEPDYSGLHIYLIYYMTGLQFVGDAYSINGYEDNSVNRAMIKTVTLKLLNGISFDRLVSQINKSAGAIVPNVFFEYQERLVMYKAGDCSKPTKSDCLNGFIENIPADTNGEKLVNAIKERHSKVQHLLGSKDSKYIGLKLQNLDSKIMSDVLQKLISLGIPALPVHDSVIVPSIHKAIAIKVMKTAYNSNTGFLIDVA